ncbi:GNAT family N-acetyltransferase [Bilifractor sp. HCP3S3_D3]|uniref:GNAT family N-acetyltransferase n=1 Tax=Bilifractor sp. HCP3S3_D3 TaxID=3438907 RepID=UPI003F8942CF
MRLRKLEEKDAPLMLEWMHDDSVVHFLQTNFAAKDIDDCKTFINIAKNETENLHLAIVDDNDEYMGTVSLKDIHKNSAEFAITIRKCAMGKGYSSFGMSEIIREGFSRGLKCIYWCVAPENCRAVRFYDKNGYHRCKAPDNLENYTKSQIDHYFWYEIKNRR